jgi:uncharacterized membrane protein YeaQ/YmgE (transglycosylase-associated protein family)
MGIIGVIIIGAAAGLFATRMMRVEAGLVTTVSIGILGALVGGLILRGLLAAATLLAGFVGAVMGALLLIFLWLRFGPKG